MSAMGMKVPLPQGLSPPNPSWNAMGSIQILALIPDSTRKTKRFWPGGRRTFHHGSLAAGSRQSARWTPREGCVVRDAPARRGFGPHGEGSRRAAARLSAVRWQHVPPDPAKSMGGAKGRGRGRDRVGALWSRPLWGAHPRLRFLDGREPARARTSPYVVAGKRASVSSRRADQGRGSDTCRRSPLDRVQESGSGLPRLLAGKRPYGRFPRPWSSLSASTRGIRRCAPGGEVLEPSHEGGEVLRAVSKVLDANVLVRSVAIARLVAHTGPAHGRDADNFVEERVRGGSKAPRPYVRWTAVHVSGACDASLRNPGVIGSRARFQRVVVHNLDVPETFSPQVAPEFPELVCGLHPREHAEVEPHTGGRRVHGLRPGALVARRESADCARRREDSMLKEGGSGLSDEGGPAAPCLEQLFFAKLRPAKVSKVLLARLHCGLRPSRNEDSPVRVPQGVQRSNEPPRGIREDRGPHAMLVDCRCAGHELNVESAFAAELNLRGASY